MEGRGEAMAAGGGSNSASRGWDGEDPLVMETMLMEQVEAEVGADFQGEVDGSDKVGILKDTLHVTEAGSIGGDSQVADGLG